jgi:hypothetical protein
MAVYLSAEELIEVLQDVSPMTPVRISLYGKDYELDIINYENNEVILRVVWDK